MTRYHAVMLDECGDGFGTHVDAETYHDARDKLHEDHPESRGILSIETERDISQRVREAELKAQRDYDEGIDYDEDGRPFSTR